jgi:hypothetical protein
LKASLTADSRRCNAARATMPVSPGMRE